MSHKGTDTDGDERLCMVIGCGKRALYRRMPSKRGYCSGHRHMAVTQASRNSAAKQADWLAEWERVVGIEIGAYQ